MNALVKIAIFVAALAAVFAASLGFGVAVGPTGDDPTREKGAPSVGHDAASESTETADPGPGGLPAGLMVSQDGYALQLATTVDLTPGSWRVFADFKPSGAEALTLGADLAVAGTYRPADTMPESRIALVDSYEVNLTGDLTAGADAKLAPTVTKDGQPVTDLQPYLVAYGHLVALGEGDLAYLHVHPGGTPGDGRTSPGPDVVFYAEVPSDGNHRLYLDLRHRGVVRTATFAVSASAPGTALATPGSASPSPDTGHATH